MARELRRLLIAPERLGPELLLRPEEAGYLTRVLRYRPGDRLEIIDGRGGLWCAALLDADRLRLEQPPDAPLRREPPAPIALELALAVPKRDADLVVRMACELGVDRLQPLRAERSALVGELRTERWGAILREASEQCERLWLPGVAEAAEALAWLGQQPPTLGDSQRPGSCRLLATTRRPELPLLAAVLAELAGEPPGRLTLACGPEGGWSEAEESAAFAAGWRPVSLGPRILRCSTAAVAGLALLDHWRAARSGSPPPPWPLP